MVIFFVHKYFLVLFLTASKGNYKNNKFATVY